MPRSARADDEVAKSIAIHVTNAVHHIRRSVGEVAE